MIIGGVNRSRGTALVAIDSKDHALRDSANKLLEKCFLFFSNGYSAIYQRRRLRDLQNISLYCQVNE